MIYIYCGSRVQTLRLVVNWGENSCGRCRPAEAGCGVSSLRWQIKYDHSMVFRGSTEGVHSTLISRDCYTFIVQYFFNAQS